MPPTDADMEAARLLLLEQAMPILPSDVIEYENTAPKAQAIVDAGSSPIAGTLPTGLTRDELGAWIIGRFSGK